jgi:hypothetical protein
MRFGSDTVTPQSLKVNSYSDPTRPIGTRGGKCALIILGDLNSGGTQV